MPIDASNVYECKELIRTLEHTIESIKLSKSDWQKPFSAMTNIPIIVHSDIGRWTNYRNTYLFIESTSDRAMYFAAYHPRIIVEEPDEDFDPLAAKDSLENEVWSFSRYSEHIQEIRNELTKLPLALNDMLDTDINKFNTEIENDNASLKVKLYLEYKGTDNKKLNVDVIVRYGLYIYEENKTEYDEIKEFKLGSLSIPIRVVDVNKVRQLSLKMVSDATKFDDLEYLAKSRANDLNVAKDFDSDTYQVEYQSKGLIYNNVNHRGRVVASSINQIPTSTLEGSGTEVIGSIRCETGLFTCKSSSFKYNVNIDISDDADSVAISVQNKISHRYLSSKCKELEKMKYTATADDVIHGREFDKAYEYIKKQMLEFAAEAEKEEPYIDVEFIHHIVNEIKPKGDVINIVVNNMLPVCKIDDIMMKMRVLGNIHCKIANGIYYAVVHDTVTFYLATDVDITFYIGYAPNSAKNAIILTGRMDKQEQFSAIMEEEFKRYRNYTSKFNFILLDSINYKYYNKFKRWT